MLFRSHKNILSDYDIFSESRYFIAGEDNTPIRYKNQNIRILFDEYESEYIDKTDSFVIFIGMTPFTVDSSREKRKVLATLAQKYNKNLIAVNHVGSYTSVLFDGNSMVYNYKGKKACQLNEFAEDFQLIDTNKLGTPTLQSPVSQDRIALLHKALV